MVDVKGCTGSSFCLACLLVLVMFGCDVVLLWFCVGLLFQVIFVFPEAAVDRGVFGLVFGAPAVC